jgi:DNA mismatch repair protein MutL
MTIKVLDSRVISQIAAGEVVERPASVAKELVENALDAGATQISLEIRGGGIELIRVIDNGSGIADDQTEIAFERHATSKINSLSDLESLNSLGFRGEALPSIAAVARVEMLTAQAGALSGSYLELEDGQWLKHEKQARPPGTTISVVHLFRQLPARLKFLKSAAAESGRIADIVSQYALAYPEVRFTLVNEARTVLRTPGSGRLIDALSAVYGATVASQMIEVATHPVGSGPAGSVPAGFHTALDDIQISGLVSAPQLVRATRDFLSFFVNRRWVNNRLLGFAVEEAYHGLLMQGKHPLAVINLRIPANRIDVNVHPAKTEIKFQDERAVFSALQRAVRAVLVQSSPVHQVEDSHPRFITPSTPFSAVPAPPSIQSPIWPSGGDQNTLRANNDAAEKPSADISPNANPESPPDRTAAAPGPTPLISLPLLRILGQLACNYIVAEGPDGLYLIDQHAAHERVMLEKLSRQRSERQVEVQGLLPPSTIEIEPRLAAVLNTHLEHLREMGFEVEPFGPAAFMVRSIPAVLSGRDWLAALRESLDAPRGEWSENLLNRTACHSAIRAGQILTPDEMRELLRQLEKCALPNSCPHGRPTMVRLTLTQIQKEFGRLP